MRYALFILLGLLFLTCSKNNSNDSTGLTDHFSKSVLDSILKFNETFQIGFTLDNKNYSMTFPKGTANLGYGNIIVIPAGIYSASGAFITFPDKSLLKLLLGNSAGNPTTNWPEAYQSFKSLMNIGVKTYDSLFDCIQFNTNRVEIIFIDEAGFWCSTKQTIVNGWVAQRSIDQPGSNFRISDYREVSIGGNKFNAAIIKGTFNCILYRSTTFEKRNLTNGTFTLLITL